MKSLSAVAWFFAIAVLVIFAMFARATTKAISSFSPAPAAVVTEIFVPRSGECVTPKEGTDLYLSRRGDQVILEGSVPVIPGNELWVQDDGEGGPFIHLGWLEVTAILNEERVEGHLPLAKVEACP